MSPAIRSGVLAVTVLVATALLHPARAQVSPGRLARPHAELEGATRCFKCHGPRLGAEGINRQCLDCHTDIDWYASRRLGLHGQVADRACQLCHPEHAGEDFELISWEEGSAEKFRHDRTGWPLEGKHATVRCRDCHKPQNQRGEAAPLIKTKDRSKSWLGLDRACLSCHEDYHRGTLDRDCTRCHGAVAWKPAAAFDHDRSAYPLRGKHVGVACAKCHLVEGATAPRYKPLPHDECSSCHQDPHAGRLGSACAKCHDPAGFTNGDRTGFDHSRTRYPLRGAHASVECARCHDPRRGWGKKPPFETCEACHGDVHAGQALRAGKKADCSACHSETRFKPSSYGVEQHRTSPYPLEGKHAEVSCEKCHPKNPAGVAAGSLGKAGVRIRRPHEACRDCHADAHAGQLAGRKDRGACESCHRVQGWKPSTYTAERHAETKLDLLGRHREIECAACHSAKRRGLPPLPRPEALGPALVVLTKIDAECRSCHHDPHAGRFDPGGTRPIRDGCEACHAPTGFRPSLVDTVRHDEFGYKLEGAHRAVPCILCHEELKKAPSSIKLLAVTGAPRPLSFERRHDGCADCHAGPHGDQFDARAGGRECGTCHDVEAFEPASRFDHDRDSKFPLAGQHREVRCADCHRSKLDGDGRPVIVYRSVPSQCKDCHGAASRARG